MNCKRIVISISTFLGLGIILSMNNVLSFDANRTNLYVDDKIVLLENGIMNIEGSTYIPLRETFEKIGFNVDWDGETNTIRVRKHSDSKLVDNIYQADEGAINSGQSYKFIPFADTVLKESSKALEEFNDSIIYNSERKRDLVPDKLSAINIAKSYFYASTTENENNEAISYNVTYDEYNGAWIVTESASQTLSRSLKGIMIRSCDGLVLGVRNM